MAGGDLPARAKLGRTSDSPKRQENASALPTPVLRWFLFLWLFLTAAALFWGNRSFANPLTPLGEFFFAISPSALNGLQAGIERYVSESLWAVVFAILQVPAAALFLLLTIVFTLLAVRKPNSSSS